MVILQYTKNFPEAFPPTKPHADYPGYELRSPRSSYLLKGRKDEINLGLTLRIPPGYYGVVGPKIEPGPGIAVLVTYLPCQTNHRLVLTVQALRDTVNIKRGDVLGMLVLKKVVDNVELVEKPSTDMMVNMNPSPVVNFCRLTKDAYLPEATEDGYIIKSPYACDIQTGCRVVVSTGLAFKFPEGYYGVLKVHENLLWNHHLTVEGGIIKPNNRSEVKFLLTPTTLSNCHVCGDGHVFTPGEALAILQVRRSWSSRMVEVTSYDMGIGTEIEELEVIESTEQAAENHVQQDEDPREGPSGSGKGEKHSREEDSDSDSTEEGAEPEKGFPPTLKRQRKPTCAPTCNGEGIPTIANGMVFSATLVFYHSVPWRDDLDAIILALEEECRAQAHVYSDCDCDGSRPDNTFFASCVKQVCGPVVTLLFVFSGSSVFPRDQRRLALAFEEAIKRACDLNRLSCEVKLTPVSSEFVHFL